MCSMKKYIAIDWKPDRSNSLPVYRQIVEYIRGKVSSGDWTIGSKLPSQRMMAQQFEVNRSTVMAAMAELHSYGLLESNAGMGTHIASNTWSLLMSAAPPDWNNYLHAGSFQANVPTIQTINKLEFERDVIRLGTGELAQELFPRELMTGILHNLPKSIPSLNYLEPLGLFPLREALAKRLQKRGIAASPSSILITSGSLQALQLISVCMLKPGAAIYTEAPSYVKSLQVFQSAGMKLCGLPMDAEGICYWDMPSSAAEKSDSLLYTIPSFHNPTGSVMSARRRDELFRCCRSRRLPIIEDDAYGELWFDEEPPRPLKAMDENGMILYLGTISKTLAPGLRIGWMAGPESVVERLGDVKMQIDYGASSVSQWIVNELLRGGGYDEYLQALREKLKARRDLAVSVLERCFKGIGSWEIPQGSFYIWLRLHKGISTDELFREALKERILINPGSVYDYGKNSAIRLSYAYAKEGELVEGLEKLAGLIRRRLQEE